MNKQEDVKRKRSENWNELDKVSTIVGLLKQNFCLKYIHTYFV